MDEKKRILEMLDNGKITVEEAVALLEALGEKRAAESTRASYKDSKKTDFDEKFNKTFEDIGKRMNSFTENLGVYMQNLGKFGDQVISSFSSAFDRGFRDGRSFRFEENIKGIIKDGSVIRINSNGPVSIQGIDSDEFSLELVKMVRSEDETKASVIAKEFIDIETTEDKIEINLLDKRELWLEVKINLPRNYQYQVEIQSINGKLSLLDLDLISTKLSTVNGRINIEKCSGDTLALNTINGGIDASGAFNLIDYVTHNGSIDCYLQDGNAKVSLKSTNGSLRVRVPIKQSIDYNIEASTGWGKINVDLPLKELKVNRSGNNFVQAKTISDKEKTETLNIRAFTSNGAITFLPLS